MNIFSKARNMQKKVQASLTFIVYAVDISKIFKGWKGMKIIALITKQTSRRKLLLMKSKQKKLMTLLYY